MNIPIPLLVVPVLILGCASSESPPELSPYISKESQFIPDEVPLRDLETTDLEEFAITLPIFETGDAVAWIESGPGATNLENEWFIHADGAQAPIRIERLEPSPDGAQRIRVLIGPSMIGVDSAPRIWVHELERARGGWKKLGTYKEVPQLDGGR